MRKFSKRTAAAIAILITLSLAVGIMAYFDSRGDALSGAIALVAEMVGLITGVCIAGLNDDDQDSE